MKQTSQCHQRNVWEFWCPFYIGAVVGNHLSLPSSSHSGLSCLPCSYPLWSQDIPQFQGRQQKFFHSRAISSSFVQYFFFQATTDPVVATNMFAEASQGGGNDTILCERRLNFAERNVLLRPESVCLHVDSRVADVATTMWPKEKDQDSHKCQLLILLSQWTHATNILLLNLPKL